jgi:hypothetical protein
MKTTIYLFSILTILFSSTSYAQNGCGAAIALTPGTQQCGNSAGFAGDFPGVANPCNSFYDDDEYWFSYTGNGVDGLDLTLSNLTNTYAGLFVLDACAGACEASSTNGASTADLSVSTGVLNNGQTYYIVIANWGTPNNTAFCLDATLNTPPAPGAGDGCANAVALTPGTQQCGDSNPNLGDFPNNGGAPTNPCNTSYNDNEFWYSYTGTGDELQLDLTSISDTYAGLFVFDACAGASPNCVASITNGGSTADMSLLTPTLTIGQQYYIVIVNYGTPDATTFCLNALNAIVSTPPANDDPCGATPIIAGATCSFSTYSNTGAMNSDLTTTAGIPSCANFQGGDVWFSVTVPASGHLIFDSNTGSITDAGMAIYTGTCGTLTEINCDDDGSANGSMSLIDQIGLVPGDTVWIRLWEYGGDVFGTFDLCVYDGDVGVGGPCTGGAGGDDCPDLVPICTDNTYCYTAGIGSTASAGNDYGCLTTQPNPSWYYFEISTAGNLVFDITAGSDIDFALWGPFANAASASASCGSLPAPIDCSYSTSPTEQATVTGTIVGEVYVLIVTNYAAVSQDITLSVAGGNTATTDCSIVAPNPCNPDAGSW